MKHWMVSSTDADGRTRFRPHDNIAVATCDFTSERARGKEVHAFVWDHGESLVPEWKPVEW